MPVECRDQPQNCPIKGLFCTQRGKCVQPPIPPREGEDFEVPFTGVPDGWADPVALGDTFIVNLIQIADPSQGFDLDGNNRIDNVLGPLGTELNVPLRQGVQGGDVLLMFEIAGLDDPYTGDDPSVTLKFYRAVDANDIGADNFMNPGTGSCCEFDVSLGSTGVDGEGNRIAIARGPAKVEGGRLITTRPLEIAFPITIGSPPFPTIVLERITLSAGVDSDRQRLSRGIFGGAVAARSVSTVRNPFCSSSGSQLCPGGTSSKLLDLVTTLAGPAPDIDLDGDGRECALDSNGDFLVDLCCDGAGPAVCSKNQGACPGATIASLDPADPALCTAAPDFADGYSIAFTFSAVRARVVGFAR